MAAEGPGTKVGVHQESETPNDWGPYCRVTIANMRVIGERETE